MNYNNSILYVFNIDYVFNINYVKIIYLYIENIKESEIMNKKILQENLEKFSSTACMQLKYYIIKSIFPNAEDSVIKEIGGFNSNTFGKMKKAVEEKNLPLLQFEMETADSCKHECNCAEVMQKLEDQVKELQEQAQMELDNYIKKEQEFKRQVQELEKEVLELRVKVDYYKVKSEKEIGTSNAMSLF
jgi:hypothetical protein